MEELVLESDVETVDITPTPKILRTLGEIPFEIWQCIAELADNSIDAFKTALEDAHDIEEPRIDVYWSKETTPAHLREFIVEDNGPGMSLESIQNAARAGYSSNDPISNLGLFGMGFNISTARLADEVCFYSTKSGDTEWRGIRINYDELIEKQSFSAPVITEDKDEVSVSGTKIVFRKLKPGAYQEIKAKHKTIRRRLESIYTPILEDRTVSFYLDGKKLDPKPHCVWDSSRYVVRKNKKIFSVQSIDRDLDDAYFDLSRNRYLTEDESSEVNLKEKSGIPVDSGIIKRTRRLKGWIGIQRYADPNDFGIDFIRNGRKILVSNKDLFGYECEETGATRIEYPIELGSTVGGRIVGELHVDYLIPTYQKNGFDKNDKAWRLTIEAVRGGGPILPKMRSAMGYNDDNESPLGLLINAYRRVDPGTKALFAPNSDAKKWANSFVLGKLEYQSDEIWFRAAQEYDRAKGEGGKPATPVNAGDAPSDDVGVYLDLLGDKTNGTETEVNVVPKNEINDVDQNGHLGTTRNELINKSDKEATLSGTYAYGNTPGIKVTGWKVNNHHIKIDGKRVPVRAFQDGIEMDFFYDPTHPLIAEYPITPKQIILQQLAEKFSVRDAGVTIQSAFFGLVDNHLQDERVNVTHLRERASAVLTHIKEQLPVLLRHRATCCIELIKSSPSDAEAVLSRMLNEAPSLMSSFSAQDEKSHLTLEYVNDKSIAKLLDKMPEELMDGKLFNVPYSSIQGVNENSLSELRAQAKEKVLNYLRDVSLFLSSAKHNKNELIRMSNTLAILESMVNT